MLKEVRKWTRQKGDLILARAALRPKKWALAIRSLSGSTFLRASFLLADNFLFRPGLRPKQKKGRKEVVIGEQL
jgi:hypothetical protein